MNAVNPENVNTYFDLLENKFDQFIFYSYSETIYNMNEIGMLLEPRPPKIVAHRGQNKIHYQTSDQKQQITVISQEMLQGRLFLHLLYLQESK